MMIWGKQGVLFAEYQVISEEGNAKIVITKLSTKIRKRAPAGLIKVVRGRSHLFNWWQPCQGQPLRLRRGRKVHCRRSEPNARDQAACELARSRTSYVLPATTLGCRKRVGVILPLLSL